jgi:hypothetical protein
MPWTNGSFMKHDKHAPGLVQAMGFSEVWHHHLGFPPDDTPIIFIVDIDVIVIVLWKKYICSIYT